MITYRARRVTDGPPGDLGVRRPAGEKS